MRASDVWRQPGWEPKTLAVRRIQTYAARAPFATCSCTGSLAASEVESLRNIHWFQFLCERFCPIFMAGLAIGSYARRTGCNTCRLCFARFRWREMARRLANVLWLTIAIRSLRKNARFRRDREVIASGHPAGIRKCSRQCLGSRSDRWQGHYSSVRITRLERRQPKRIPACCI